LRLSPLAFNLDPFPLSPDFLPSALFVSTVFVSIKGQKIAVALISEFMLAKNLSEDYNLTSKKTIDQPKGGFYG
jgi:hypothetical protein